MVKVVAIFLMLMLVVALIGNALAPGSVWRQLGKAAGLKRCPDCGRPMIGQSCSCKGRG